MNASLSGVGGSPWHLVSALGVATEAPEAPLPIYGQYVGLNSTMAICGNLAGVTVWNSSGIPVFTGNLGTGGAPFWSFILKNSTASFLYATSILGTDRMYPSTLSTPCIMASGLADWGPVNDSITNNSPRVSDVAYTAGGKQFALRHSPLAEYYMLGSSQLTELDSSPFGWVVNYFRCDLVGVSGLQNYTAVGTSANATSWFVDNGWLTCTASNYTLAFAVPARNVTPAGVNGTDLSVSFQVTFPLNHSTFYDGWGLQTWMTQLQLTNPEGTHLSDAPASCQHWVLSLSDCPSNGSGWFAVLLSANGSWLDSFPSLQNLTNWSIPNVFVTSHDRIVAILPPGWSATNDSLAAAASPSAPDVAGAVTL